MIIDGTIFLILILVSGILFGFLLGLPFSIALFYEKIFRRTAFPFLFIVSGVLFAISFFFFSYDFFGATGSGFFAAGGIVLALASIRLYLVMTGGR